LVGCPIADFAKKNGYTELMPYFYETDKQADNMPTALPATVKRETVSFAFVPAYHGYLGVKIKTIEYEQSSGFCYHFFLYVFKFCRKSEYASDSPA
jgi:hypothetical protein